MARANFNNQTKRARELAKKDKRAAKDGKRAQKKADARAARGGAVGTAPSTRQTLRPRRRRPRPNVLSLARAGG
jgi:hypothetical protein